MEIVGKEFRGLLEKAVDLMAKRKINTIGTSVKAGESEYYISIEMKG